MYPILKGMLLGAAGFFIFSVGDVLIKLETQKLHLLECTFFALASAILILLALSFRAGGPRTALASRNLGLQLLRAVLMAGEFLLVFYAFTHLPMANVYTLVLLTPVLTVMLAPLVTTDKFDAKVLPAVILGFIGVLAALRPGLAPLEWPAIGALFSALLFTTANLLVRRMSKDEPPLIFAFYPALCLFAVGGIYMIRTGFNIPPATDCLILFAAGGCSALALTLLGKATQLAPASAVMPFQYTQIIWGAIAGALVFGDALEPHVMLGGAIIIASGILLVRAERRGKPETAL